ncbi:hypothetical protein BB560_001588 [Smittium megazygosporum]|uniref:Deoxyhypusine hydroxylase n=1 Tax=Smittium megazygosporum TaxID=133381 RepID=A0A2T9ZH58_9FUNG|nr:hypothetical protein BB560_001588 [Smittium megazygosporum]
MSADTQSTLENLEKILVNEQGEFPLYKRYRALFSLKGLGSKEAIQIIIKATKKEKDSELFKHELAYCLGQLQNPEAIALLEDLVRDEDEFIMVRHEAAEALGAISDERSIQFLKTFIGGSCKELSETCYLAAKKIEYNKETEIKHENLYGSVDPTPPANEELNVKQLRDILLDQNADLWERYRSMFRLRDIASKEAVLALCDALLQDKTSALFRHEICFVFGELQDKLTADALQKTLANTSEAPMVRHEAAEALGSIAESYVSSALKHYSEDPVAVVRESCIVALDMNEYQNSEEFQYAIIPN